MNESSKVPAKFESIIIIPSGVMNFQSRKLRKKNSTLTHIHLTHFRACLDIQLCQPKHSTLKLDFAEIYLELG
jgi:hypothetical protein